MQMARMTPFQRALNRYVHKGIATAREMAEVVGCTAQHIRAVARGDRHLPHPKVETLSAWLVDEREVTEHIDGMLGIKGAVHFHPEEVEHDGCLQDEIFEARNHAAEADQMMKSGDDTQAAKKMRKAIAEMKAALADIES